MAKAVGVGQVAEWFKATVLKTSQGHGDKPPNPRNSNTYRPRITRTERFSQRFAMAQMPAHIKPLASLQGNEGQSITARRRSRT